MKNQISKFIINLFTFSVCFASLVFLAILVVPLKYISEVIWFLFPFFISISIILFLLIVKFSKVRPAQFIPRFMLLTVLKLILFAIVMILYVFKFRPDAVGFILNFFVFYFAYSTFEIISVVSFLKNA